MLTNFIDVAGYSIYCFVFACRLQREIEACRNSSEEAECHQLTKELENLQRMSYQKQMKYHSISRTAKKGMNRSPIHHSDCRNLHSSQADNDHQNSILEERRVTPLEQTSHTSGVTMADCEGETHKRSRCERAENSSSVKKRVADGEWLTGDQDECEDWELEALAEASELTTLDLSGDDDSNVCIIDKEEEEEKITTYHDRTGDSNLLKWLSPCGQVSVVTSSPCMFLAGISYYPQGYSSSCCSQWHQTCKRESSV